MLVAEIVIHLLSDAPTKEAALRLPLVAPPPASVRTVDKARLKSATLLTSQSPMSPHVVVAVVGFWTQSLIGRAVQIQIEDEKEGHKGGQ